MEFLDLALSLSLFFAREGGETEERPEKGVLPETTRKLDNINDTGQFLRLHAMKDNDP